MINKRSWISTSFVLFQYFLSTVLIIAAIVIFRQTNLLKNKSLGFNSENIIELSIPADFSDDNTRLFKEQLLESSVIVNVAGMDKGFTGNSSSYDMKNDVGGQHIIRMIKIDQDYIETLGLNLLIGENFTADNITASNDKAIVNEKFLSTMNMDMLPGGYVNILSMHEFRIIGVVKDFHFDSMKDEIQPLMLIPNDKYEIIRYLYIKYLPNRSEEAISAIEKVWETNLPGREMQYSYLDQLLSLRYQDEERWGKIVGYASFLAILISSLGLFGLTLIVINKRIREIGIRKVNGASMKQILLMLNRNFITKILVAFIVACPVAGIMMNRWLENFAYKTEVNLWVYLFAGAIVVFIALLTVNWQCWNAARKNPVEALNY